MTKVDRYRALFFDHQWFKRMPKNPSSHIAAGPTDFSLLAEWEPKLTTRNCRRSVESSSHRNSGACDGLQGDCAH